MPHEAVLDVAALLGRGGLLVRDGVVRVAGGDAAGLAVERGREEQRLAVARGGGHDAVDDGAEAHVEHAVGLVEHEEPDARRVTSPRRMRSSRRPGVATRTCALRAARACFSRPAPP